MTQSELMRVPWGMCGLLAVALLQPAFDAAAQPADEPVTVSADHPRLLLRPARLRLLRRERERKSARWQQFEALVSGKAPMAEPGFSQALYFQVAGDQDAGRRAISWALGPASDLRQQALIYDWCHDLLTDSQRGELAARLRKGLADAPENTMSAVRSRTLAATALFDEVPDLPRQELERVVRGWWQSKMVPALKGGRAVIARDDAYALFELLHVIRDNTNLDLRESVPQFFKDFPIEHLLSYYPAAYDSPDGQYYIGAEREAGPPDVRLAALSRAAELAMVAYDPNAPDTQVLQGWLMHDRFILRGTFGSPYEFLWANPYQPGLSYYHVPLVYYNPDFGRLFVRSSWDDTAKWFGYWDGMMQVFDQGKVMVIDPRRMTAPVAMEEALIYFAPASGKLHVKMGEEEAVFLVGLEPRHGYTVEVDDEEMFDAKADPGGIIMLEVPRGKDVGVRFQPAN